MLLRPIAKLTIALRLAAAAMHAQALVVSRVELRALLLAAAERAPRRA
jgi:hypothetical protein